MSDQFGVRCASPSCRVSGVLSVPNLLAALAALKRMGWLVRSPHGDDLETFCPRCRVTEDAG